MNSLKSRAQKSTVELRNQIFGAFEVAIDGHGLVGRAHGETILPGRHDLAVEVKGATMTELSVVEEKPGWWRAQCVVGCLAPIAVRGQLMEISRFERLSDTAWQVPATGTMRVPAVIYATEDLIRAMDEKVFEQVTNVAKLPGRRRQ